MSIIDQMSEMYPFEVLNRAVGFDDAIIGVSTPSPGRPPLVVYNTRSCIQILMDRDEMTEEEAWEFFEFNVQGAWVGDTTPLYIDVLEADDVQG